MVDKRLKSLVEVLKNGYREEAEAEFSHRNLHCSIEAGYKKDVYSEILKKVNELYGTDYQPPHVMRETIGMLSNRWTGLFQQCSLNDPDHPRWHATAGFFNLESKIFNEEILQRYNAPCPSSNTLQRSYHTLEHLRQGLVEFDEVVSQFEHPREALFGFYLHDAIYNPQAFDNEEQSAQLCYKTALSLGLSEDFAQRSARLVRVTARGTIPITLDEQLFVDIDYSILGQPKLVYQQYTTGIYAEFSFIPDNIFRPKRAKFLEELLAREHIYYTDYFRKKYGLSAQANITQELKKLQSWL